MENEVDKCLDNFLLIDEESKLFKRIKKENKDFNDYIYFHMKYPLRYYY